MTDTEKAALERRIDELCAEVEAERQRNDKMFEAAVKWMAKAAHFEAENAKLRADQAHWELGNCPGCPNIADLQEALEQNGKLREQTELLVTLLRNDCDIEASWDGLRKFWYIGLTESGCPMRDMACKAEAENAKLRDENAKLLELADSSYTFAFNCYHGVFDQEAFFRLREKYHDARIEVPS